MELQQNESDAVALQRVEDSDRQRQLSDQQASEQVAVSKALAMAVLHDIEDCRAKLTALEAEVSAWQSQVNAAKNSDVGRGIAQSDAAIERAMEILARPEVLSLPSIASLRNKLGVLAEPIESAAKDPQPGYQPNSTIIDQITKLRSEAISAAESLRDSRSQLESLIRLHQHDDLTSDSPTLVAAIENLSQQRLAEKIAKAEQLSLEQRRENDTLLAKAREEAAAKVVAAKADAIRKKGEKDAEEAAAEARRERARKAAELAKAKQEAEFQAALPEIRTHLTAFLSPGMKLRGPNPTLDPAPASFAVLSGLGVMANTVQGKLAFIKATDPYRNDRSKHKFTSNMVYIRPDLWQAADMTFIDKAHALLRKFGPLLVEKGMLEP